MAKKLLALGLPLSVKKKEEISQCKQRKKMRLTQDVKL